MLLALVSTSEIEGHPASASGVYETARVAIGKHLVTHARALGARNARWRNATGLPRSSCAKLPSLLKNTDSLV